MPAHSSWQLIVATMQRTASFLHRDAEEELHRLRDDGSSSIVNYSRSAQMQMVMVAVGGFSILEGILEQTRGWAEPFNQMDRELRAKGLGAIADDFMNFRQAVNVLKHGFGRSYEQLIQRDKLPFRVKKADENFFDEGDIAEIPGLVLVDKDFVLACSIMIEQVCEALEIPRLDI